MAQANYLPQVTAVRVLAPFGLGIRFSDRTVRHIDLTIALRTTLVGPIFAPLQDPAFFAQAYLDREGATVAWPNGADIAPESSMRISKRGCNTIAAGAHVRDWETPR